MQYHKMLLEQLLHIFPKYTQSIYPDQTAPVGEDWPGLTLFDIPTIHFTHLIFRERSGSVVECLIGDRGAAGSSLTGVTALYP